MLVPGRECGDCTICCEVLSIDTRPFKKPAGIMCHHNRGGGCGIYDTRFPICREWFCAWRLSNTLDDSWRPDRSGILVELVTDGLPQGYAPPGIKFSLLRSADDVLWPPLVDLVTRAIRVQQAIFLELVGPPGHLAARTFLNMPSLNAAVASSDDDAIRASLRHAADCLLAHPWEKIPA